MAQNHIGAKREEFDRGWLVRPLRNLKTKYGKLVQEKMACQLNVFSPCPITLAQSFPSKLP